MSHNFGKSSKASIASFNNRSAASRLFRAHSSLALFIMTLGVGAEARAFANKRRALSYSEFSDSSFTAASQISSEFGFAWKASERIPRASGTSPCNFNSNEERKIQREGTILGKRKSTHSQPLGFRSHEPKNFALGTISHCSFKQCFKRLSSAISFFEICSSEPNGFFARKRCQGISVNCSGAFQGSLLGAL